MMRWNTARRTLFAAAVAGTFFAATARSADPAREFPDDSYYFKASDPHQTKLEALVGKPMPELQLADWIGTAVTPTEMKGKVVIIDIWATWCGPCRAAIPHNNELLAKYGKDGLVIVGVCSSANGQEKLADVAKSDKIAYPVAKDPDEKTAKAYGISFYPTYIVVDRAGKVRGAGLSPDGVEAAVKKLLAESPPA